MYAYSLPFDVAGETAALVAHDGLDALLDVDLESVTVLSPAVIRRQHGWTAPNLG